MMSMNIRSFNKVTKKSFYFKLFYRKKVSEATSLLEYSTNYHQKIDDNQSYIDRIMWMCLFGFKVNRLALTISFVLVYPLLCALLISTEACYAPQHRSTLELCLLFALCILFDKWFATKPLLLVEFLLTKNAHHRMGAAALPYLVVAPPKVVTAVAKCLQLGVSVRISDSASTGVCPLFVVNPGRPKAIIASCLVF